LLQWELSEQLQPLIRLPKLKPVCSGDLRQDNLPLPRILSDSPLLLVPQPRSVLELPSQLLQLGLVFLERRSLQLLWAPLAHQRQRHNSNQRRVYSGRSHQLSEPQHPHCSVSLLRLRRLVSLLQLHRSVSLLRLERRCLVLRLSSLDKSLSLWERWAGP
jgi:hypothetical protein